MNKFFLVGMIHFGGANDSKDQKDMDDEELNRHTDWLGRIRMREAKVEKAMAVVEICDVNVVAAQKALDKVDAEVEKEVVLKVLGKELRGACAPFNFSIRFQ